MTSIFNCSRFITIGGFLLAVATPSLVAGQPAAQPTRSLKIVVVDGEDAVNVIQQKSAVAPVVEVRDRNDQPVAGAIVRFAIGRGRATFSGARALTVTTNAAGRAVAAGLTPTGAGALQISASATFEGQTALATIAQTNVMTAAQAAAASAAGASGAGGSGGGAGAGGAAGGGSAGGMSATTIGVVGGVAAGGAIAATEVLGGSGTKYVGPFGGAVLRTVGPTPICTVTETISGTLTLELDSGSMSGKGKMDITDTPTAATCTGVALNQAQSFSRDVSTVSNNGGSVSFHYQGSNTFTAANGGSGVFTLTVDFTGTLNGNEITGTMVYNMHDEGTVGALQRISNGQVSMPVVLR